MPCVITVKKRMQDDPDCKSISGIWSMRGRSCRSRKPVSDVRVHGTVQKDESTWHAIYLTCRRMWERTEYPRFSRSRSRKNRTRNCHERHADIQKELQKKGIGIEMCPISNLQTKAVESIKDYPMREFLNAGLKVTANTDNRTVSNTTLTKELEFIQKNYGITDEEIHLMMRNAVDVAFADDAVKERMLKYV